MTRSGVWLQDRRNSLSSPVPANGAAPAICPSVFDNGASLFIGNHLTPKTKTVKVQTEYVNSALVRYNPEIVQATKKLGPARPLRRAAKDNEIAAQKGLGSPTRCWNGVSNDGADERPAV